MSKYVLSSNELEQSYLLIQHRPYSLSEKKLAYFCSQSRLDPRLAEVVTEHIREFWWKYDAEILNSALRRSKWPAAILVMLEQIKVMCLASVKTDARFSTWTSLVTREIKVDHSRQLYFIGTWMPASRSLKRQIKNSLDSYLKFNFYGTDTLFNKKNAKQLGEPAASTVQWRDSLRVALCQKIVEEKKIRKLNGKQLAALLNTDQTSVSNMLSCRIDHFSVDYLAEKVSMLGLSPKI